MKSAERMKYFRPSVFSRLDEEKRRLQEKGEKIIDFSIGSPDIAPAPHIMEALLKAAEDFNIDLSQSWMVGDGENDIKAGYNAGCRTALIGRESYGQTVTIPTLKEFAEQCLK